MKNRRIMIGSRGSQLALWQSEWVKQQLNRKDSSLEVRITIIKTKGDKILDSPLSRIGDKGLFTKEIEEALLAGKIDLAVHSLKDIPTELPGGLSIGAVTQREDPRDVFIPHVNNPVRSLLNQPSGASIATGSLRRKCQLLAVRPDFRVHDIRGNLNTRLQKLDVSNWSGMILAHAGVVRLGWQKRVGEIVDARMLLPAVGQGALGIEVREDDDSTRELIGHLDHRETALATTAERSLLRRLEGGCQVPIGTYGRIESDSRLHLDALVGSLDGKAVIRGSMEDNPDQAASLGTRLAEVLLSRGADRILQQIRTSMPRGNGIPV